MTAQASGPTDFDFWVGDWDCRWDGGHGSNHISKELGGRVLIERFEATVPEPFSGMSLTAFDGVSDTWRQIWADTAGNVWTFAGGLQEDRVVLTASDPKDPPNGLKRMIFLNIAADGLDWRWEGSADGRTWRLLWAIRYERRPPR